MKLTKDEKELIIRLLKKHQDDIEHIEKFANQDPVMFRAEVRYDEFLEKLIKKLS